MPQNLEGSLPGVPITDGQQVVLEARDPTSGAAVTGVKVSDISIYGLDLVGDGTATLEPLPGVLLLPTDANLFSTRF